VRSTTESTLAVLTFASVTTSSRASEATTTIIAVVFFVAGCPAVVASTFGCGDASVPLKVTVMLRCCDVS